MAPHVGPPNQDKRALAVAAAADLPKVTWYKSPNMRTLYFFAFVLCINSATTGYDGE